MEEIVPFAFEPLMTEEELAEHEITISKGKQAFIAVGKALHDINERRGYRFTHGTFADYVEQRWGMSISSGYNTMAAAQVVENVQPVGQIDYTKAVALSRLEPEQQRVFAEEHNLEEMTKREVEKAVSEWKKRTHESERRAEEAERQLKQAQRESAATREQAQSIIERDRQLREENERLKAQKNPEPKVVEKVVQVAPPDYERVLREHQALNNKNVELTMKIDQIQTEYQNKLQDIRDGGERAALRDLRKGLREQLDVLSWHQNGALMTYKAYLIGNPEAVKTIREFLDTYEQKTTETIQKWRDALNAKTEDETVWTII